MFTLSSSRRQEIRKFFNLGSCDEGIYSQHAEPTRVFVALTDYATLSYGIPGEGNSRQKNIVGSYVVIFRDIASSILVQQQF